MTGRARVFFLCTSLSIGGTEKFLLTLAEKLRDRYDLRVGYLKDKGAIGELLEKQGFEVRRFRSPAAIVSYLIKNDISILHTFLYRGNILGRLCGKIAGVPVVISTQQSIDIWKGPFFRMLDRLSARWCDLIIANSAVAKEVLVRDVGVPQDKIEIVLNGLDFGSFAVTDAKEDIRKTLGIPPNAKIVVAVARLHAEKGVDFLPSIAQKTPESFFLLVGDGPEMGSLRHEAVAGGLDKRFLLLGWRDDIPRILKAADIFILPSREESFPQAVLEAMAMRLPVVAADVGGVKELVEEGKTGLLVQPGDIEGFVHALRTLLADTNAARQMGESGFAKVRSLTAEKMVSEVEAAYRTLLEKKKARFS